MSNTRDLIYKNIDLENYVNDAKLVNNTYNWSVDYGAVIDVKATIAQDTRYKITNDIRLGFLNRGGGENYITLYSSEKASFISDLSGKYMYIYILAVTEQGNVPVRANLNMYGTTTLITALTVDNIDTGVYLIRGKVLISNVNLTNFLIDIKYTSTVIPVVFTDFRLSKNANDRGVWNIAENYYLPQTEVGVNPQTSSELYNNRYKISKFIRKYNTKEVDVYNQLNVVLCGDSVLGRIDSTLTPITPQMSYTPDTNGGVGDGYTTGHFPPNMWEQLVAYKLYDYLKFSQQDVKYFNHSAAEVLKTGTWEINPATKDNIRFIRTTELNATVSMPFTDVSFVKVVYTCYANNTSAGKRIKIDFSIDGGSSYVTPESLGLTCNLTNNGTDGEYTLSSYVIKFGQILYKGMTQGVNYIIRVTCLQQTIGIWGFETWSNKRINVIVNSIGGLTAAEQSKYFFSNDNQNADLVIYEMSYINDLGTGVINNYKGKAVTNTYPSNTPAVNDFWYATNTGVYTQFSGISANAGDYMEYNGSAWQVGRTSLDAKLAIYKANLINIINTINTLSTPVLLIIPHSASSHINIRMFMQNEGYTILRTLAAETNAAVLDLGFKQIYEGKNTSIQVDGTHLNDEGVDFYIDNIKNIVNNQFLKTINTTTKNIVDKIKGTNISAGVITFGYSLESIPVVRVYNNSGITISSITRNGFTATGVGTFDYEAYTY